jgi:hypothetical protein
VWETAWLGLRAVTDITTSKLSNAGHGMGSPQAIEMARYAFAINVFTLSATALFIGAKLKEPLPSDQVGVPVRSPVDHPSDHPTAKPPLR